MATPPKEIYTRNDFLKASQLVAELNNQYDEKTICAAMMQMHRNNVQIMVNGHKTEAVVNPKWLHRHTRGEKIPLRLHPAYDARVKLLQYLGKGK